MSMRMSMSMMAVARAPRVLRGIRRGIFDPRGTDRGEDAAQSAVAADLLSAFGFRFPAGTVRRLRATARHVLTRGARAMTPGERLALLPYLSALHRYRGVDPFLRILLSIDHGTTNLPNPSVSVLDAYCRIGEVFDPDAYLHVAFDRHPRSHPRPVVTICVPLTPPFVAIRASLDAAWSRAVRAGERFRDNVLCVACGDPTRPLLEGAPCVDRWVRCPEHAEAGRCKRSGGGGSCDPFAGGATRAVPIDLPAAVDLLRHLGAISSLECAMLVHHNASLLCNAVGAAHVYEAARDSLSHRLHLTATLFLDTALQHAA